MDQLWAPWRLEYIAGAKQPGAEGRCFICDAAASADDRANLIVMRTPLSVVILNRYPYNNGHLLVGPLGHKGTLDQLTAAELMESMETVRRAVATLQEQIHPDGFNIGLNLGRTAGAGLPGHLHWHIVPRWNGDTNFMPVVADTKVISQSLDALYDLIVGPLAERGRNTT
jgi:ATP adenylyltransferase